MKGRKKDIAAQFGIPTNTSNFDQIFNHLYLENEKTFIRIFFCL
jgi:hypothetical protein